MSNSEYISRDAVDNVLLELEERVKNNPFALTAMAMAIDKIDNIPPADVVPVVRGYWDDPAITDREINYVSPCKCSVCGNVNATLLTTFFYCGHCGAKMADIEEAEK